LVFSFCAKKSRIKVVINPRNEGKRTILNFFIPRKFLRKTSQRSSKIAFISQFATELCFLTYFTDLGAQVKMSKTVFINPIISVNVYDNPSFCSELIVFFKGREHPWLTMKASSIMNGGFGVFAARSFVKNEFVMCYLGVLDFEPQDVTYTFKNINAVPELPRGELKEDVRIFTA
jgi:hypothetical protein